MPTDNILRIAVCDDLSTDRAEVVGMTIDTLQQLGQRYEITEYENGRELLDAIQRGVVYHILLLDVMMDEMTGMELASQLRRQHNKTAIVFISSNREMALCGYEVSAARFLAKPLDPEKMTEALIYCIRQWKEKKEILLPTEQGEHRVLLSQILYAEAYDRGTRFVLEHEVVEAKCKFGEAEAMLPSKAFVLCHRAFLVNLAKVKMIRRYEFVLKSGETISIGKARYSEVYRRFMDYIAE